MKDEAILFSSNNVFSEFDINYENASQKHLNDAAISECATLRFGPIYKGVQLYFLDMSTGSTTGTFKDWVACATVAYCHQNGIKEFVTQSSGNTANALAQYCEKNKLKANIFYLKDNIYKIKPRCFEERKYVTVYEVSTTEKRMKELTAEFSNQNKIPWLPNLELQIKGNSIRADIINHVSKLHAIRFDWLSQALSSGYGVFGFYDGIRRLGKDALSDYKFIGVQQTAVCPFVKRFSPHLVNSATLKNEKVIERTLFRSTPTEQLYDLMDAILKEFGGELALISNADYSSISSLATNILSQSGMDVIRDVNGEHYEKSGLINLVGVIKLIDEGIVKRGETVLVSVTGGCGNPPIEYITPDFIKK